MAPIITSYLKLDSAGARMAGVELKNEMQGFDKSVRNAVISGELLAKVIEKGFSMAASAVKSAASAATSFFRGSIAEAREAAEVNSNLDISLRRLGTTFSANSAVIETWADSIGNMAGRDGEEAKAALSQLLNANMSLNDAMRSGKLVADMAAKGHVSQAEAAKLLALTYQGSFRGLRQFGIIPPDELSKIEQIEWALRRLGDITNGAAMAEQQRSPLAQWENAIANIKEMLGNELLPVFSRVMRPMNEFIIGLRGSETLKAAFEGIARWIESFLSGAIKVVLSLAHGFDPSNWGSSLMTILKQAMSLVWDILSKAGEMIGDKIRLALPKALGGGATQAENVWRALDKMYADKNPEERKAEAERLRTSLAAGEGNWYTRKRDEGRLEFLDRQTRGFTGFGEQESFASIVERHSRDITAAAKAAMPPPLPGTETAASLMQRGASELAMQTRNASQLVAPATAPASMEASARRAQQRKLLAAANAEMGKYGGDAGQAIGRSRLASVTLVNHGSDMMDVESTI